ncbi:zinc ribbon domain-containing protein [Clostridium manihotivorum]|uniref:AraC family transcriptional regulator n=1 Tax=Clostridium manihotivorum TaxID=2320868 RepID=A0A410DPR1_9CLOT|nr:zinc ribbon domain-containing protein [Clostridium manihotivorum]QAA31035.1 AraC family transcriptional regulator [Clostridium manihotivorum]
MKKCIACGMPMEKTSDFPNGDETKNYCKHCAKPDGSMQSYEEKLESLTNFVIRTQGLSQDAANSAAKSMMEKLPAWQSC